ncbi:MAG: DegT/DnrJ/EryC1/StrS family aminotransferase [Candidatus Hydrogenedentota bacterium]
MKQFKINFNAIQLKQADIKRVIEVLESGWLAHGKYSKALEQEICKLTGSKYCVLVSSCTAALHLSMIACCVGRGDEVIVPVQTHVATAHAVEYTGAKPVFVDVELDTGNIDVRCLKKAISPKTKGIIVVHLAGQSARMKEIMDIAKRRGVFVVEDCAHAPGTLYRGQHVGTFGITGCFSFYPTKHITTGEGGAVITNDVKIYNKINHYKAFGIDTPPELRKRPGVYDVCGLGYNYRMTDFQAAMGYSQIIRFKTENLKLRQKIAKNYIRLLSPLRNKISFPDFNKECSYFFFPIYIKNDIRDLVIMDLKEAQVGVSIHYATIVPMMSYYKNKYNLSEDLFPNGSYIARHQITLPAQPSLTLAEQKYIAAVLKASLRRRSQ